MSLAGEEVILWKGRDRATGLFDAERRLAALSEKGDPLKAIAALVPWESFRADIEAIVLTPEEAKKSKAGRTPLNALIFPQAMYNLNVKGDKEFNHANRPDGWNVWLTFRSCRLSLPNHLDYVRWGGCIRNSLSILCYCLAFWRDTDKL